MKKNHEAKLVIFNLFFISFMLIALVTMSNSDNEVLRLTLAIMLIVISLILVIVNILHFVTEHKSRSANL